MRMCLSVSSGAVVLNLQNDRKDDSHVTPWENGTVEHAITPFRQKGFVVHFKINQLWSMCRNFKSSNRNRWRFIAFRERCATKLCKLRETELCNRAEWSPVKWSGPYSPVQKCDQIWWTWGWDWNIFQSLEEVQIRTGCKAPVKYPHQQWRGWQSINIL